MRFEPHRERGLERLEKADELLFVSRCQFPEMPDHMLRLAFVPLDGILQRQRLEVVHESRARAQAPKRRRAQLVGRILRPRLYDSITCFDVMQQEVAIWMNDLVAQRLGYEERPAINGRSWTGRGDRRYVTGTAAGAGEQAFSGKSGRGGCEDCIARGHLRAPDELRKMIDIGEAEIVRNVLRVYRHLADGRGVLRAQSVGHAHFVQVGVADEREQTAVLVFPAETPNTRLAWRLKKRYLDGFAVDPARADFGLACGDCQQRAVVDRFDESVSQSVERCAQCPNVLGDWNAFLCLRDDGAIIHYGSAANLVSAIVDWHRGIHEVAVCVEMADPQLGELARSAAYRVLMAFDTCSRVKHGTESCVYIVCGLVDLLIELKSVARRLGNSVARAL